MSKPKNIQEIINALDSDKVDYKRMSIDELKQRDFILKSVLTGIRDNLLSLEQHLKELIDE